MNLTSKIDACKALIHHPKTPEEEREAARRLLVRLQARAQRDGHNDGAAPGTPGYHGPGRRAYGAKYTGYIRSAALTKLIRADIAVLRKLGRQPARPGEVKAPEPIGDAPASIRFSVKKDDYAGGRSIDITITGVPADWWIDQPDPYDSTMKWRKAGPQLTALKEALQEITWAYNYDGSDLLTDYHDRNFYDHYRADGHGEGDYPRDI
ncbi:hypothetical protein [Nonomuraea wenchangensis]|uniref:DUF2786 domain-containing protein n=1 Tax=Nonomuraea wenchangensis TaxID=568860 RepID=A0A1I0LVR6_9ACTN|nr:hypothetical protein [Nonomuraea wenchangensis]SEU46779.1 hypothetical protein SAMN05421811_127143 [Nonomuraea wenchangensis]